MSHEKIPYDELLKRYRELQLRVTRFSAIEQELINTRDRLDSELELYKKLQQYSVQSMRCADEHALLTLATEAIVDILEVECAVVYVKCLTDENQSRFAQEGLRLQESWLSLAGEMVCCSTGNNHAQTVLLSGSDMASYRLLSGFSQAVFSHYRNAEMGFECYFMGAITHSHAGTYNVMSDRHRQIFGIFSNEMQVNIAHRKQNEKIAQQLRQIARSEQELRKLSLIATRTKSGVVIADTYGRIEWVNHAFTEITGYGMDEVLGKKPKDFLHGPDTSLKDKERLQEALAAKTDIELVVLNYNKNGQPYHNLLEVISVFDEAGRHTHFIAIQKDISVEIQSRQEILRINSRFQLISAFAGIGIWEWDVWKDVINWNEALFGIYGTPALETADEIRALWRDVIFDEDRNAVTQMFEKLRSGEIRYQHLNYRIRRKSDGTTRYLQTMTVAEFDEWGKLVRIIGSVQDITDLKSLQHNLEQALTDRDANLKRISEIKLFYERILWHSPSLIEVYDARRVLLFTNAPVRSDNPVSASWAAHFDRAISAKKLVHFEDVSSVLEEKHTFLRSILPDINAQGEIESIIVISHDISYLKKIEEDLSRKNEELKKTNMELDQFVYSISHDLRSPLLSIKGIVALLLRSSELSPENIHMLRLTMGSASRLDETIQEILEYSRNSRLNLTVSSFDVSLLVKTVFEDLRFSTEIPARMELRVEGDPMLVSDKPRLGILLKNVIGNSIKYRKKDTASVVNVSLTGKDDRFLIRVEDNGEGIPAKHLDKVFDMFYRATTSHTGTGLGLYICREIAQKLGGEMSIQSTEGVGTTVMLELPLHQAASTATNE